VRTKLLLDSIVARLPVPVNAKQTLRLYQRDGIYALALLLPLEGGPWKGYLRPAMRATVQPPEKPGIIVYFERLVRGGR